MSLKEIKVGNKLVGENHPILIIAEAANNHTGNFKIAANMIKAAAKMGADAVKFQCWKAASFAVHDHPYYKLYKKIDFSKKQWAFLRNLAKKLKLLFFVDVLDEESLELMHSINIDAYKIHAGDINNYDLIEKIAKKKKPILLHTGSATYKEIKKAASIIKKHNKKIIPMFGFQDYPTKMKQLNLRVLKTLKKDISQVVGFMDHTIGILAPLVAVGVGANIIEKHFSLNRKLKNYDWQSAIEPPKFKIMVHNIREAEKALGNDKLILSKNEKKWLPLIRKTIVAKIDIKKSNKITKEMLVFKRSKPGLAPPEFKKVVGRTAKKQIKKDSLITLSALK